MKIKCNDNIYCFPNSSKINFLVENEHKREFIKCLYEYFGKKKKTYCQAFNDDGEQVLYNEMEFIYLPYEKTSIESNMNFYPKSVMAIETSKLVDENLEKFQTIEKMRNLMHDLLTDTGFYQLKKILSNHMERMIEFKVDNFETGKLLEMLRIENYCENEVDRYMILYNLLIYLNRNNNSMIYIDFPITRKTMRWINAYAEQGQTFIIDNVFMERCYDELDTCSLIIFSNENFMEKIQYEINEFQAISYVFHPYIQQHIQLQSKKILGYYSQLSDKMSTFFLQFERNEYQKHR